MANEPRRLSALDIQFQAELMEGVKQEELDSVGLEPEKGPEGIPAGMPGEFGGRYSSQRGKRDMREGLQQTWEAQWQDFLKTMESEQSSHRVPRFAGSVPNGHARDFLPHFERLTGIRDQPAEPLSGLGSEIPRTESNLWVKPGGGGMKVKEEEEEENLENSDLQRLRFRIFSYQEAKEPREAYERLRELCRQWLQPEKRTKGQVVELVILEQFLAILPKEMQSWVRKSGPETCSQAVALAEQFLLRPQEGERPEEQVLDPSRKETSDLVEGEEVFQDDWQPPFFQEIKQEDDLADIFLGAVTAAAKVTVRPTKIADRAQPPHHEVGHERMIEEGEEEMEEQEPTTSTTFAQPWVPWFGFEKAVTFMRQKGKNVIVQCNYCLPLFKTLSSAISSSSNVKQHFKKAHPKELQAILEIVGGRTGRRRRPELTCEDEEEGSPAMKMARTRSDFRRWQCGRDISFQKVFDQKLLDYVVEETVPLQTVDKPTFRALVCLGLPKDLTLMCAKTLREKIEQKAADMRETLTKRMGGVSYVATTADCWTSGRRRFLSVTAHWINPATMKRECGALACKRLKGPRTYGVLAKALHGVHVQYRIDDKVVATVTDNGSHFVRALQVSKAREPAAEAAIDDGNQEEAKVEYLPISEILDTDDEEEEDAGDEEEFFCLPPQQRCASHTLNLVVTEDLQALIPDSCKHSPVGPFKKHFRALVGKCSKLWSKQSQSEEIAEYIHQQCGTRLKVPDKTQWHSTFEALKQLNELLSTRPQKVDAVRDHCGVARITDAERLVLEEYTEIMAPLARSLDILQHKNSLFMAYLLPTLYSLDRKLQRLEDRPEPYTYCLPLLKGLREALRNRFAPIWEDKKLLLASCLHPLFKLDWLPSDTSETNRSALEALMKAEIKALNMEDKDQPSEKEQEDDSDQDFFFDVTEPTRRSAAEEEISRYLKTPRRELSTSSLEDFPRILQIFLKYNTSVPSSAALESLFGPEGSVMTVENHSLSDEVFEQLVLLKQNRRLSTSLL
nr:uncharacterized protein LOC110070727 isoform X1 [Pogona vitticeps]XP_020634104.1 uncharacterized protein LOC110070727 isoform X1 [Pogona vitticeps]